MIGNSQTNCFQNLSVDHKSCMSGRLEQVYRTYNGYMVSTMAILGLLLTTLFLVATFRAVRRRRVSRKYHVLLMNRSIGDLFTCLAVFLCSLYVMFANCINKDVAFIILSFFTSSFWSAMVSYTTISLIKLFAVWKPLEYRSCVTMRRCIYLIVFSWIVFTLMSAITLSTSALVKIPSLTALTGCKIETCSRTMHRVRTMTSAVTYFFTISVFIVTVLVIRRTYSVNNRRPSDASIFSGQKKRRFPLWKLSINVGTFAIFHGFYVGWGIYLLTNRDRCKYVRNYAEMTLIFSFVRAAVLLRIIADVLLTFCTDSGVRNSLLEMLWKMPRSTSVTV